MVEQTIYQLFDEKGCWEKVRKRSLERGFDAGNRVVLARFSAWLPGSRTDQRWKRRGSFQRGKALYKLLSFKDYYLQ